MESPSSSAEDVGTFLKPLQGFLALKNYQSARSILEILVDKYGSAFTLTDWATVIEAVVQVVGDFLAVSKPVKKGLELPTKLTALALLQLEKIPESQHAACLNLMLDLWSRLGNLYLGAAQRTGAQWLLLAACRFFVRVMQLCNDQVGEEFEAFRKAAEQSMDHLEIAVLWHSCLPRVALTLTLLCSQLRSLSANETLEAVSAVFNTEPMVALRGIAEKFGPSQFVMCKCLPELLNPVLTELQSSLGTLAQKSASDSAGLVGLADRVTTVANQLMIFREFQDAVVECYQILSRHTSEEKVLKLLAASWQTKLDLAVNPQMLQQVPLNSCWRRDREVLSELRRSCARVLALDSTLEFHTRYSEGMLSLARQMVSDSLQSMGPPPCPFAVIATGSLSRREMSLGSDLDLSILVRSRDIPIAFFSRLIEQLELRLQWQALALDELTVSYILKANEFGLNNVPALVCSLHAEFSKGSTNVEPFALLWPSVVFSTVDGNKLCQEFVEGTQAYFSGDLVSQQTGFNWLKAHMPNLKQFQRGPLVDRSQGSCNIKKELLQPLTVWCLDFAVFNGILTQYSTLGCLNALQAQGKLHPRFVEQMRQALVFLHSLRVHKQSGGADSDEFFPPEMNTSLPTPTSRSPPPPPLRRPPSTPSSSPPPPPPRRPSSICSSPSNALSLAPFSESLDEMKQSPRGSGIAKPLPKLTSREWHTLQHIQRHLVRPILVAMESLSSKLQQKLESSKFDGTKPQDIFATAFPFQFDPLITFIAILAHKIFQQAAESWESEVEDAKEISEVERQQIESELSEALSYLASTSVASVRSAGVTQAVEGQKAVFNSIVPISRIRSLYCRFLREQLAAEFSKAEVDCVMNALAQCPTPSGVRKMLLDEEHEWQHLLEQGLTCKSDCVSDLEILLEWAHVTEEQQSPCRRAIRNCFQDILLDVDGGVKQFPTLHGEVVLEMSSAEIAGTSIDVALSPSISIKLNHPDPCFELCVQWLGSKITGFRTQATLAKLTVVRVGLPLDSMIPVLISRPFAPGSMRGDEADVDRLNFDRRAFTLKLFETMVLRPEDESLSNLVIEPIHTTTQPISYRLHRVSHRNCFVRHAVIERREGARKTEKLGCHSFILCMSAMQEQLSHDAIAETLLLDPKQLLDSWLADMGAHNAIYASTDRRQSSIRMAPLDSSDTIFSSSEIHRLDELRVGQHNHPIVSHAIAPNVVQALFQRLVFLLQILRRPEASKYTHLNLLEEMDPLLHHYYQSNCWFSKTSTSLQRWQAIPQGFNESKAGYMGYAVREPIQFVNPAPEAASSRRDVHPRAAKGHLKQVSCFLSDAQLARGRLAKGLLRQNDQPLMDAAYEQMINSTDFTRLTRNDGWDNVEVLQELFGTIKFRALRLSHCDKLTDPLLSTILQFSDWTLTSLDISGCSNLGVVSSFNDILAAIAACKQLEILDMSSLDALASLTGKNKKGISKPLLFNCLQQLNLSQCVHLTQVKLLAPCLESVTARDCLALQVVEIYSQVPLSVDLRGCHKLGESTLQDLFDPPFLKFLKSDTVLHHEASGLPRVASSMRLEPRSEPLETRSKIKRNQLLWVDFSGSSGFDSVTIPPEVSIKTLLLNNCPQLASLSIQNDHIQALSLQDCRVLAKVALSCHNLHEIDLGGSCFSLFPVIISGILQGCTTLLKMRTRCAFSDIFKRTEDIDTLLARTTPHVAVLTEPLDGIRQVCEEILQGTHDTVAAVLVNVGSILAITSCFLTCTHSGTINQARKRNAPPPEQLPPCCKLRNVKHLVLKCPPGFDLVDHSGVVALSRMAQTVWLHSLHLEGMNLGDQGSTMITEAFQSNFTGKLKVLRLVNTGIGDQGCLSVARLVQSCQLIELSLKENKFGDKGCRALAAACQSTPQLRMLDISENKFMTVDGLYAIATAVDRHADMKFRVGLWNPALQKLAKGWRRKMKLRGISMRMKKDEPSKRDNDLEMDVHQCLFCLTLTESKESCSRCGNPLSMETELPLSDVTSKSEKKEHEVTPKKSLKLFFSDDGKSRHEEHSPKRAQTWLCGCGRVNLDSISICECGLVMDAKALYQLMRCLDNVVCAPAQSFLDCISQSFKPQANLTS